MEISFPCGGYKADPVFIPYDRHHAFISEGSTLLILSLPELKVQTNFQSPSELEGGVITSMHVFPTKCDSEEKEKRTKLVGHLFVFLRRESSTKLYSWLICHNDERNDNNCIDYFLTNMSEIKLPCADIRGVASWCNSEEIKFLLCNYQRDDPYSLEILKLSGFTNDLKFTITKEDMGTIPLCQDESSYGWSGHSFFDIYDNTVCHSIYNAKENEPKALIYQIDKLKGGGKSDIIELQTPAGYTTCHNVKFLNSQTVILCASGLEGSGEMLLYDVQFSKNDNMKKTQIFPSNTLTWHAHGVNGLAVSSTKDVIYTVGQEGVLVCWSLISQEFTKTFHPELGDQAVSVSVPQYIDKFSKSKSSSYALVKQADNQIICVDLIEGTTTRFVGTTFLPSTILQWHSHYKQSLKTPLKAHKNKTTYSKLIQPWNLSLGNKLGNSAKVKYRQINNSKMFIGPLEVQNTRKHQKLVAKDIRSNAFINLIDLKHKDLVVSCDNAHRVQQDSKFLTRFFGGNGVKSRSYGLIDAVPNCDGNYILALLGRENYSRSALSKISQLRLFHVNDRSPENEHIYHSEASPYINKGLISVYDVQDPHTGEIIYFEFVKDVWVTACNNGIVRFWSGYAEEDNDVVLGISLVDTLTIADCDKGELKGLTIDEDLEVCAIYNDQLTCFKKEKRKKEDSSCVWHRISTHQMNSKADDTEQENDSSSQPLIRKNCLKMLKQNILLLLRPTGVVAIDMKSINKKEFDDCSQFMEFNTYDYHIDVTNPGSFVASLDDKVILYYKSDSKNRLKLIHGWEINSGILGVVATSSEKEKKEHYIVYQDREMRLCKVLTES